MSVSPAFTFKLSTTYWTGNYLGQLRTSYPKKRLTVLSTLNLMNEVSDVVFAVLVAPLAVPFVNLVFGLALMLLHRLNCVEDLITVFECATNFVRRHDRKSVDLQCCSGI